MWAAIAMAVVGAVSSAKSAKKQKKAARAEQEMVRLQNVKARNQALKEYRMARAQVLTGVVNSGVDIRSSGYQGIQGSLQSQVQENIEFSLEQEQLGGQANKAREQAARYNSIAQAMSSGANIAQGASALRSANTSAAAAGTTTSAPTNPNVNASPFSYTGYGGD